MKYHFKTVVVSLILCLGSIICAQGIAHATDSKYLDYSAPLEERIEDALSRMTLEEKVKMVHAQSKFSSAGVPITRISPPISLMISFRATPAAMDVAAIKLCPQPCPTSGKASYSHKYAITGPALPLLYTA